jgi:hypothetical protein
MPSGTEEKLVLLYVSRINQGMTACCQTFPAADAAESKRFSKLNLEIVSLLKRINKTRLGKPNFQLVPLFENDKYKQVAHSQPQISSTFQIMQKQHLRELEKSIGKNANQFLQASHVSTGNAYMFRRHSGTDIISTSWRFILPISWYC